MNKNFESLPLKSTKEIPVTDKNSYKSVTLKKQNGEVANYKLFNNHVVDKKQAVNMARTEKFKVWESPKEAETNI